MNGNSSHADPAELESLLCQLATHSQASWTWGVLERDILVSRALWHWSDGFGDKYHKEAPRCAGCACIDRDVQPDSLSAPATMDTLTPKCHPQSTSILQVLSRSIRHCLLIELSRCFALPIAPFPCWYLLTVSSCYSADGTGLVPQGHVRTQHAQ